MNYPDKVGWYCDNLPHHGAFQPITRKALELY